MQWNRAKTIMIAVFLLINIFLVSYLVLERHTENQQTLQYLTDVLAKNDILLHSDAVIAWEESLFVPEFSAPVLSQKQIAKLMENPIATETGYQSADGNATWELKDNVFVYENKAPKQRAFRKVTEKNVVSKLNPYLKALGIEDSVYPVDISQIQEDIVVEYAYQPDERKLFDSRLRISVNQNGIRSIRGLLAVADRKNGFSYTLSKPETVLLGLAQTNEGSMEISQIELGYYFISYSDALVSQAIPVYQIRTSQGDIVMDARDGLESSERILSQKGKGGTK